VPAEVAPPTLPRPVLESLWWRRLLLIGRFSALAAALGFAAPWLWLFPMLADADDAFGEGWMQRLMDYGLRAGLVLAVLGGVVALLFSGRRPAVVLDLQVVEVEKPPEASGGNELADVVGPLTDSDRHGLTVITLGMWGIRAGRCVPLHGQRPTRVNAPTVEQRRVLSPGMRRRVVVIGDTVVAVLPDVVPVDAAGNAGS
jgi:hypothetical protein